MIVMPRLPALFAALLGAGVAAGCGAHVEPNRTSPMPPALQLAVARRGDLVASVVAQGRIGPPDGSTTKLVFAESGLLASLAVRVGDRIRAGQPLAELDRSVLAPPLAAAAGDARSAAAGYADGAVPNAAEASARAKLAVALERLATLERGGPAAQNGRIGAESAARQALLKAEADTAALARTETLFAAGVVARKDLDAARAQLAGDRADDEAAAARVAAAVADGRSALAQARADVVAARNDVALARSQSGVLAGLATSAQARLAAARIAYEKGILTAPADGVVLAILKHPGEAVDVSTPVIEVGPAVGSTVTVSVATAAARRIRAGDPAELRISGTNAIAHGRVAAVVPVVDPATQQNTIVVEGAPPGALPGDAVSATIVVGRTPGIIVPAAAVVTDPQTGKTVVFVRDPHPAAGESGFDLREVVVRASDATNVALARGLQPGESVAAEGGYLLLAPPGG